jgi:hypothetical protein
VGERVSVHVDARSWPAGEYGSTAWIDDMTIVAGLTPQEADGRSKGGRLVALGLDRADPIALPHEMSSRTCDFIDEFRPTRLDDGRIAYLRDCVRYREGNELIAILAVDPASREVQVVAELGETWTKDWRAQIGAFTMRHGTEEIDVDLGDGLCGGIGNVADGSVAPIEMPIPGAPGADLADIWTEPCAQTVNAGLAAWSPNGRQLAFVVAPDSRGHDGWERADAPRNLLLIDEETGASRELATRLISPNRLSWSPNGTTIAVITAAGGAERSTTSLISVDTGARRELVLDNGATLADISWSPDGLRLAGVLTDPDLDDDDWTTHVVVIDLP